jgi:undecaprenyl-diphosphatase
MMRRNWGTPRLLPAQIHETPTGRLSVRQVFPPRVALARGRGAVVVVLVALAAFTALFAFVRKDRSRRLDLRVTRSVQRIDARWFEQLMHVVSWPGFPPQSRIIPPALAALWLALGFPLEALFQMLAWGVGGVSALVKSAMRRPRPAAPDVRVVIARIAGSSFPSGHVLIYTGVYGFLAYLVDTLVRPVWLRRATIAALIGLLALVGPSRIYLGHHWFTDTIASYLLGTSYLLGLTALYRRVKTRWINRRRQPRTLTS